MHAHGAPHRKRTSHATTRWEKTALLSSLAMSIVVPSPCTSTWPSCSAARTVASGGPLAGPMEKPTADPSAAATLNE
eukprot:scaffold222624_cov32-Tisochrysis_lutea.AAC.2